ncbi:MAG: hypothetical protein IT289_12325 [Oligoflexia bacterium]|nr:hypothetical protein [Oligoflexia bacterium]
MLTPADLSTVYEFIKQTGENNIKKMMTGGKMSPVHVGLLLKIVRACNLEEFTKHCEGSSFPKIKYKPEEDKIKEAFWGIASETFVSLGLVSVQKAA